MHFFFFSVPRTVIGWILVGLIAGWLAGKVSRGRGFGCIANIILGLVMNSTCNMNDSTYNRIWALF